MIQRTGVAAELAQCESVLGSYRVGKASRLSDSSFLANAQDYRRQASARMIPSERRDIAIRMPSAEYHVSRKIDGEFTVLVWKQGQLFTINPGGTVRTGMPWHFEAMQRLEKAGVQDALFAGELYGQPFEGRRPRVHDIVSMARQPRDNDLERIRFAVFDVIELEGKSMAGRFRDAWNAVEQIFGGGMQVHPVESVWVRDSHQVEALFDKWVVGEGAEGVIARSETAGTFKLKPRHTLDLVVIGFTESTGERQGMLHDMLLAICRPDGTLQVVSRVGGGLTEDDRREMLSDLKDLAVESQYAEVNSEHVAYQMVEPKWVVEVSCLDMVSQTTRGTPVQRMVLNYRAQGTAGYELVRSLPMATLISPQFIRRREDKACTSADVRVEQISDVVEVPMVHIDPRSLTRPKSELISREVFTKELKGQTMVRKFVLWATHKSEDGDDFLAYALHYTDFSPNRKTPLEREVRVSNSLEQIQRILSDYKLEYIKQGWKPYGLTAEAAEEPEMERGTTAVPAKKPRKSKKVKDQDA